MFTAGRRIVRLGSFWFALCALIVTIPLALPAAPSAATSVLRFSIEDGYDVASDGLGDYIDFRLLADPGDTADINYCVEAVPGGSLTFPMMNRSLDALGGAGTIKCDDPIARRQFVLHIDSSVVCTELMDNNYGWSDGGTGCFLDGYRNPRIRVDKLFVSRPRPIVSFLIGRNSLVNPPDAPTYSLQGDSSAAVFVSGDTRTVEYGFSSGQTFHLVKLGGTTTTTKGKGAPPPAWAQPFTMTLRMTFTATVAQ